MPLLIHRGGWEATEADLYAVEVPDASSSYHPVPYGRFIEEVKLHLPRFDLAVRSEAYALAREGQQMFGVLTCTNGVAGKDYALAVGLRNSYDRSLAVGLVSGSRVLCCDNLAFSGEVRMQRRHTAHVFRDLPDLIYRMLGQVSVLKARTDDEIAAMKGHPLDDRGAHHLMMSALRANAITVSRLPHVLDAWLSPRHPEFQPRTASRVFNAFTEVAKAAAPRAQMEGSLRLSSLFRRELLAS